LLRREGGVEGEVGLKHVDPWLSQYAEGLPLHMIADHGPDLIDVSASRGGDASGLGQGVGWRDVGIQP
jgi:hypothetical protein